MTRFLPQGNPPITAREHKLFFAVSSVPLLIRLFELALNLAFPEQPKPGVVHAIYSIFDRWDLVSPLYCFVAFLFIVPLSLKIEITTLAMSLFPLSSLTFFFDYWFIDSQIRIRWLLNGNPNYELRMLDFVIIWGSIYDVVTLLLVNVLFIWHLSLIFRIYSSNRQSRLS